MTFERLLDRVLAVTLCSAVATTCVASGLNAVVDQDPYGLVLLLALIAVAWSAGISIIRDRW